MLPSFSPEKMCVAFTGQKAKTIHIFFSLNATMGESSKFPKS